MLTRTENGYGLGSYEGIPTKLPNGRNITVTETRAALCKINGLTQVKAAELMYCSKSNVNQMWQSIFFKTTTSDALIVVVKLLELGILKHLAIFLLILSGAVNTKSPVNTEETNRPLRSRQARTRGKRKTRLSHNNSGLISLVGINAVELYSEIDIRAMSS